MSHRSHDRCRFCGRAGSGRGQYEVDSLSKNNSAERHTVAPGEPEPKLIDKFILISFFLHPMNSQPSLCVRLDLPAHARAITRCGHPLTVRKAERPCVAWLKFLSPSPNPAVN